jgi:hypothetical protein
MSQTETAEKLGSDVLALFRGAVDNKLETWKNLTAIEKILKMTVCEDRLEDVILRYTFNSSAQITQQDLKNMLRECVQPYEKEGTDGTSN